MDFELTDEQKLFQSTLRSFVESKIRPVAHEWEQSGRYPTEIVDQMAQMGLFGITVPRDYGGLEVDTVSLALVFEEISRAWMGISGILGSHSLACAMIARHGTSEQKAQYLPELATGARRTGIGLTEPDAGTDLQSIRTRAHRDGSDYIIDGTKMWITNARHADPLPILAKTDWTVEPPHRGMSVFLVEQGTPGFEVSRDIGKLGYHGTESCMVSLDNVRVPASSLLGGKEGQGLQQVLSGLEVGRINVAARAVGVAQEAFDQALEYSRQRRTFGRPIASHQAIQLKLAEMATNVQASRLLTYWAATRVDSGDRADMEAGMAKYFASETALANSIECMRIHGGMGYSTELDVERLYRDAPLMVIGEGTNELQRIVIARNLVEGRSTIG